MTARGKNKGVAAAKRLSAAKRIVVKIGSALLVDGHSHALRGDWLAGLADDLARLRARGQEVLVVSSGAIALGRNELGLAARALRLEESQAAAAIGQIELARAWREALSARDIAAAQILLTLNDTEERRRYLNARSTLTTLLKLGALPVINENDTVATSEIRYGDNDRLAARVAGMVSADCLVLLSDVDGLYTANPETDPQARLIEKVLAVTPEIEACAGGGAGRYGSGGMATKIEAGRIALQAGASMVIARGDVASPLARLEAGAPCTWFISEANPKAARKRWIAGSLVPCGVIEIDDGAARALKSGKSLLPAGITAISGTFAKGDAVIIRDIRGHELARGLSAYDGAEAHRICGLKSAEIETVLGYRGAKEVVHRDDLVLSG